MILKFGTLFMILFAWQMRQSLAHERECDTVASLEVCMGNTNVEIQVSPNDLTCEVTEVSQPQVRDDYTYTPGVGYHKLHTETRSWNDARKVCMEEGAHLAIINSKEEYQVILSRFIKEAESVHKVVDYLTPFSIWLGGHNMYAINDWVTVFGEPLASTGYVRWDKGEPNNYEGKEHCLSLYRTNEQGMNDNNCDKNFAFVCEIADVCS